MAIGQLLNPQGEEVDDDRVGSGPSLGAVF